MEEDDHDEGKKILLAVTGGIAAYNLQN